MVAVFMKCWAHILHALVFAPEISHGFMVVPSQDMLLVGKRIFLAIH
jgi:hypothetical protein